MLCRTNNNATNPNTSPPSHDAVDARMYARTQAMQALLPELPRRGKPPAIDWPALTCTVVSTAADATSGRRRERHTSSYSPLHLALTFVEMWCVRWIGLRAGVCTRVRMQACMGAP